MNAARADDAVECRSFPISLRGIATMWFTRLPPRSILCFDQLATKFVEQFRMHVARPKDVNTLSSVTQALGETLRRYLEIFHATCAEISNPNDNSVLMTLTKGIDPDFEFGNRLAGKPLRRWTVSTLKWSSF